MASQREPAKWAIQAAAGSRPRQTPRSWALDRHPRARDLEEGRAEGYEKPSMAFGFLAGTGRGAECRGVSGQAEQERGNARATCHAFEAVLADLFATSPRGPEPCLPGTLVSPAHRPRRLPSTEPGRGDGPGDSVSVCGRVAANPAFAEPEQPGSGEDIRERDWMLARVRRGMDPRTGTAWRPGERGLACRVRPEARRPGGCAWAPGTRTQRASLSRPPRARCPCRASRGGRKCHSESRHRRSSSCFVASSCPSLARSRRLARRDSISWSLLECLWLQGAPIVRVDLAKETRAWCAEEAWVGRAERRKRRTLGEEMALWDWGRGCACGPHDREGSSRHT